jgi:hypothetical protein
MDTKLKDIVNIIPLLTIIVYCLGFVIISGYFSQFGLTNDDFFNFAFIKTGLLFLLLIIPILLVLYLNFEKPTDNLLEAKKYYPMLLVNTLTYLLVVSVFLIDFHKLVNWEIFVFLLGLSTDSFLYLLATSLLFKDKKMKTKILIQLIIPVVFLSYLGFRFSYLGVLYLIVLITSQSFVLATGVIADKKYSWGHYTTQIIWVLFISFQFGRFVYGHLPNYLGGGIPTRITILAKPDKVDFLKCVGFTQSDSTNYSIDLLYISSDKYLMQMNNKTYFLSKDIFNGFISEK